MIFDTHAHYNDKAFREDLPSVLARFPAVGIGKAVNVADSVESIEQVLSLAQQYPFFYSALGIHPSCVEKLTDDILAGIESKLKEPKVVAVGEIGLDYHWDTPDRTLQQQWFLQQLRMAAREDKPVIIHSRDAAQDTMSLIRQVQQECAARNAAAPEKEQPCRLTGVVHCYSYSPEMAEEYVRMGFFIGVGGVVTFRNGRRLKETVRRIPMENIVLETDCPYLAPEPHRGERNSSLNLPYVVSAIAELRGMNSEAVEKATWDNALRLYRLT